MAIYRYNGDMEQEGRKPANGRQAPLSPARLAGAVETVADIALLNLYFLLCAIPVVTIGASVTALYRAMFLLARDEGRATKNFFAAFRENFGRATVLWLCVLLAGALFFLDWRIAGAYAFPGARAVRVAIAVIMILLLFWLQYVFPLIAQFNNTVGRTARNAALMAVRHFPVTIVLSALTLLPLISWLTLDFWLFRYGFIWLFGGIAAIAFLKAKMLHRIFMKYATNAAGREGM